MADKIMKKSNSYFRLMAIIMIIIAVGGFTVFDIKNIDEMPKPYPFLVLHALIMVSWYILLVIQTQLVNKNKLKTHIKYGMYSIILAFALVVTGIGVIYKSYIRETDPLLASVSFGTLISFSFAYGIGYFYRKRPDLHKRAMIFAGIATLPAAIGRIALTFNLFIPFILVVYFLMISSVILFDIRVRKRPHKISLFIGIVLLIIFISALYIGGTEGWSTFLSNIWG